MSARSDDWFQLVYCAEGNPPVVSEHQSLGERQIDQVLRVVGRDLGLSANTPTRPKPAVLTEGDFLSGLGVVTI